MSIVNSNNFLQKTVDGVKQFFSPLVNAATVVLKDGTRLEKDGRIHADTADDSKELGGKAPGFYTPYTNLADNSDFEHWVTQAGIGGKHGEETYGGDRWILTSGTITGTANADGDGYRNITLNGTLVQVVPSPPSVATAFVEMVSGTAEISYDASKGEIILTSAGGVIKNVLLLEGEWTEKPEYVRKGNAAELAECRRYFHRFGNKNGNDQFGFGFGNTTTIANMQLDNVEMRIVYPAIKLNGTVKLNNCISDQAITITSISINGCSCGFAYINATGTNVVKGRAYHFRTESATMDILADLPRR